MFNQKQSSARLLRNSFNFVGHLYNPFKRIFLANQPEKVISKSVPFFDFHSTILVVGGGADNSLIEIQKNQKTETLSHVDISKVLSNIARLRFGKNYPDFQNRVSYTIAAFLEFESTRKVDAILFPFYLDLFNEAEVNQNMRKAISLLQPGGMIYIIDFGSSKELDLWHSGYIRALYLLFFPITRVWRTAVPNYEDLMHHHKMVRVKKKSYYNGLYQFLAFRSQ